MSRGKNKQTKCEKKTNPPKKARVTGKSKSKKVKKKEPKGL